MDPDPPPGSCSLLVRALSWLVGGALNLHIAVSSGHGCVGTWSSLKSTLLRFLSFFLSFDPVKLITDPRSRFSFLSFHYGADEGTLDECIGSDAGRPKFNVNCRSVGSQPAKSIRTSIWIEASSARCHGEHGTG